MSDELTRVTNEEAAEAARILSKIEKLELLNDDRESWALTSTQRQLARWSSGDSFQKYQDAVFIERAKDALLDQDQAKHEKWMRLVRERSS
mgnify:CR=1 FL=1